MHKSRPIKNIKLETLIQNQKLKPLIEQVTRIEKANKHLKRFLPEPLSNYVAVCNIKGNTLILKTNSPAWFTRTNFLAKKIVDYMRNEGGLAMVERLKVKVILSEPTSKPQQRHIRKLSKATSELLVSSAQYEKDQDLARILHRLAEHTNES